MPSCLGIYIDRNIIKYAKVSKDNNTVKIEASGVRFHDGTEESSRKVIDEIINHKTPISVNSPDEKYTYANLFNILNQKDLETAAQTEFEYFCNENEKNPNTLQYVKWFIKNPTERDKLEVIYAYADKAGIVSRLKALEGAKVVDMTPLPVCIKNLVNLKAVKNTTSSVIINIERTTTVSTIVNGEVFRVDTISKGMEDILDEITKKENSYERSYEACKNSTIYTKGTKRAKIEANEHVETIMPILYLIIREIKEVMARNIMPIEKIYITGLGAVINNIDLYFQENFEDQKCEILIPHFIEATDTKVNIKEYIEVNSATALALQGLNLGIKKVSFVERKGLDKLSDILIIKKEKEVEPKNKKSNGIAFTLKRVLDRAEKAMIRILYSVIILLVLYSILSIILINQIDKRRDEVKELAKDANEKIKTVSDYTSTVDMRINEYEALLERIQQINNEWTEAITRKNAIPNLLNRIMYTIPKEVQLTRVRNTTGKTIQIEAQSERYQYLGFFLGKLKNDAILLNVKSTEGTKVGNMIRITITGDLSY